MAGAKPAAVSKAAFRAAAVFRSEGPRNSSQLKNARCTPKAAAAVETALCCPNPGGPSRSTAVLSATLWAVCAQL